MTMRDESNSAALPLANLWLDLIVGRLLNSAGSRRRVWICGGRVAGALAVRRSSRRW